MARIYIPFEFNNKPTGGGNQFLLALRGQLRAMGHYCEVPDQADCLLFNSHHFPHLQELVKLADTVRLRRRLAVVHRVDGPVSVVRGSARDLRIDNEILRFNQDIADATIFQSRWSRSVCLRFGVGREKPSTVITNAPNSRYFFPAESRRSGSTTRIRLIASSWSSNWRKGFDIYRFLDENLDHSRYEMFFVGNSPIKFKHFSHLPPVPSAQLGELLRDSDIYITASVDDPCSNAVIEAMHCGLPVVARNSGGHPELVADRGTLFDGREDVLSAIERATHFIGTQLPMPPTIEDVAQSYVRFIDSLNQNSTWPAPKIGVSAARQSQRLGTAAHIGAALLRRSARLLPLREDWFYGTAPAFRELVGEDTQELPLGDAAGWLSQVLTKLPLFVQGMQRNDLSGYFRLSQSGDLDAEPSLASSIFGAQLGARFGVLSLDGARTLAQHIITHAEHHEHQSEFDCASLRLWHGVLTALRALQIDAPSAITSQLDLTPIRIDIDELHGKLHAAARWNDSVLANSCISWAQSTGAAGAPTTVPVGAPQSAEHAAIEKGELEPLLQTHSELVQAYDRLAQPYPEIDAAIAIAAACVNPSSLKTIWHTATILAHAAQQPQGKHPILLSSLARCVLHLSAYYWPWQGGFSLFKRGALSKWQGRRLTSGMAEPDLAGTWLAVQVIDSCAAVMAAENTVDMK